MTEITAECPKCQHEFEIDIDDYIDVFEVAAEKRLE